MPEQNFEIPSQPEEEKTTRLKEVREGLYERNMLVFHETLAKRVEELKPKYQDYQEYELYHLLAGSTPLSKCPKYDFPGDDSVERFLEEQEKTLQPE